MAECYCMTDISRYQGEPDFKLMASRGVKAVGIRATVGDYYTDPMFYTNWEKAGKAGLFRTAYHVVKPACDKLAQLKRFRDVVGDRRPDFEKAGWVMDSELHDGKSASVVYSVNKYVVEGLANHAGKTPFIYTRFSFWNAYVQTSSAWRKYHLWVARYTTAPAPWSESDRSYYKPRAGEWTDWAVWQWSADKNGRGAFYGVQSPDIDLNWAKTFLFEVTAPPQVEAPEPDKEFTVLLPMIQAGTYKKIN